MSRSIAPIGVCIGTYGDHSRWAPLAERAMASVDRQTTRASFCRWVHGSNLHDARNRCARDVLHDVTRVAGVQTDWLCFLDADDTLDPGYIEAMAEVAAKIDHDALIQPSTLGVYPDGREDAEPVLIPSKPLLDGNFMVIGTLIRCDQFERLGGFHDWPCYEDWDLWIRAWRDGADLVACPGAVYRVGVNEGSRNNCARDQQVRTYNAIRSQYIQ